MQIYKYLFLVLFVLHQCAGADTDTEVEDDAEVEDTEVEDDAEVEDTEVEDNEDTEDDADTEEDTVTEDPKDVEFLLKEYNSANNDTDTKLNTVTEDNKDIEHLLKEYNIDNNLTAFTNLTIQDAPFDTLVTNDLVTSLNTSTSTTTQAIFEAGNGASDSANTSTSTTTQVPLEAANGTEDFTHIDVVDSVNITDEVKTVKSQDDTTTSTTQAPVNTEVENSPVNTTSTTQKTKPENTEAVTETAVVTEAAVEKTEAVTEPAGQTYQPSADESTTESSLNITKYIGNIKSTFAGNTTQMIVYVVVFSVCLVLVVSVTAKYCYNRFSRVNYRSHDDERYGASSPNFMYTALSDEDDEGTLTVFQKPANSYGSRR